MTRAALWNARLVTLAACAIYGCQAAASDPIAARTMPATVAGSGPNAGSGLSRGPTFSYIYAELFKSCSSATCHGIGIAGVNMATRADAYASLFNRPAQPMGRCEKTGLLRVVPGAPERSLLSAKLEVSVPCGQQMPIGGLLPDQDRELINAWIAGGALDD